MAMEQIKTQKRSLEYPEFMHRPCRTHRALVREHVRIERARDMRRQRLLRRILLLILVIAGISIAVIAGLRFSAYNINAGSSSRYVKGYKSVEIMAGDTLWSIADREMGIGYTDKREYISEVEEINRIDGNELHAGSYICVPYYEKEE